MHYNRVPPNSKYLQVTIYISLTFKVGCLLHLLNFVVKLKFRAFTADFYYYVQGVAFGKGQIFERTILRRVINTAPKLLSPAQYPSLHRLDSSPHLHAVHLPKQRQPGSRKKERLVDTSFKHTKSNKAVPSSPSENPLDTAHKCNDQLVSILILGLRPHPPHCLHHLSRPHNHHLTLATCHPLRLVPHPTERPLEAHTAPASEHIPMTPNSSCSSLMLRNTNTCITTTNSMTDSTFPGRPLLNIKLSMTHLEH